MRPLRSSTSYPIPSIPSCPQTISTAILPGLAGHVEDQSIICFLVHTCAGGPEAAMKHMTMCLSCHWSVAYDIRVQGKPRKGLGCQYLFFRFDKALLQSHFDGIINKIAPKFLSCRALPMIRSTQANRKTIFEKKRW